jgi:cell division protein FtsZ
MTINLKAPELRELKPRIMVCGVGGAGGNAVNNMIVSGLSGVDFIVANTDAQALTSSRAERIIQMGLQVTEGLGAGSHPEVGRAAAEEAIEEIRDHLAGAHMVFVTAGMGGGTGTGAAPVVARAARDIGILTVGVVTKPFQFEGPRRMRVADAGINELQKAVDTLIVIPNQNLFRVANERTTFADAFAMADQVLYSGVACITDLMVKEGLINLDFADVRAIMREMGKAMMGTGEATGEKRAMHAAEAAIANPLLDEVSMRGARGLLISITGGNDLTLYEVDEAASRIRQEVDEDANVILGATFDESLEGIVRVSVVATGIDQPLGNVAATTEQRISEAGQRLRPPKTEAPANARIAHSVTTSQETFAPAPVAPIAPPMATAAMAAAAMVSNEVELRPMQPKPVAYEEAPVAYSRAEFVEPTAAPFIPPLPEEPVMRHARMPRVEDLPLPAQNQLRAHRADAADTAPAAEAKRRSLLERLASFSMGRHDEPLPAAPRQNFPPPPAGPPVASLPPPPGPLGPSPSPVHAEYAKRPVLPAVRQPLDQHGRIMAQPRPIEDDQLEIPAFLRRQSS